MVRSVQATQPADDVFHHHDGVVDDEADSRGHAAECHDIEAAMEEFKQENSGGERRRHAEHRDEGDAAVAQEQQQHGAGEQHADQHRVAHADGGGDDEFALVIPGRDADAVRELRAVIAELRLHVARDLHGVRIGLLVDLEDNGVVAVGGDACPLRDGAEFDGRHIGDAHEPARALEQNGFADLARGGETAVGQREVELVVVLQAADGADRVGVRERLGDIGKREAVRFEARGVDGDAILRLGAAEDAHLADARHSREQRAQLIIGDVAQLGERLLVGGERVGDRRENRRVHPAHLENRSHGQRGERLVDRGFDLQHRRDHVLAPLEIDGNLRAAAAGVGAQAAQARHGADGFLDRHRNFGRHAFGRPVASIEAYDDARELHMRK